MQTFRMPTPDVWTTGNTTTKSNGAVDLEALLAVRIQTPHAFRTETPYGFAAADVQNILSRYGGLMDEHGSDTDSDDE